jgi:uncharacterized protein (DUF1015 family)
MAELRPLRALRYDPSIAGDAAGLIAPPYDVVTGIDRLELYACSPFNIARVDYGEDRQDIDAGVDHYGVVRRDLDEWMARGVLRCDEEARLYAYDQEFELDGKRLRRRAVFGALRLEEWDKGIVLPHEGTAAKAKEDRLRLLQATRVQLSPVMTLYEPNAVPELLDADLVEPVLNAVFPNERHTLRPVSRDMAAVFAESLRFSKLYVADGHHRYETGLTFRNQVRGERGDWTGEEPENFILSALISTDDPGLVVLPTHRLLKLPRPVRIQLRNLRNFRLEDGGIANQQNLEALVRRLAEARHAGPAFGAIGLEPGRLHLLTPRDLPAVIARTPADHSEAWRRLDVTIFAHAILPAVGFDDDPARIDYTESPEQALKAVNGSDWDVAFLLNPTPVSQVIEIANHGERMPRKSTFFYPKLATGMLMLPLD